MSSDQFSDLRAEYSDEPLRRKDLPKEPIALLRSWLDAAADAGAAEANAMSLATCDADGQPECRVVLLKQLDEEGFGFFTNKHSRKGQDLAANPKAAATFWWAVPRARQVRVTGVVEPLPEALAEAYFASRPRRAQLCSAASPQSRVVASREALEALVDEEERRTKGGPVKRPSHWGGYLLRPRALEFWQGRRARLHDRFRFTLVDGAWAIERLAP